MLALAAMAHLGIDDRDDPVGPRSAMQPRDAILVDVEVLADQLAQQPMRLADALVVEQAIGLLDRLQGALGVLGDTGQHPLALAALAPAAIGAFPPGARSRTPAPDRAGRPPAHRSPQPRPAARAPRD